MPVAERWFRRYRRALIAVDAVMISSAIGLTLTLKFGDSDPTVSGTGVSYLIAAGLIAVLWILVLTARDSRERRVVGAGIEEYARVINASLWTFGAVAIVSYLAEAQLSRLLFVATLPMGLVLLTFGRWVSRTVLNRLRTAGEAMTATLVVGTRDDVHRLSRDMTQRRDAGYRVAAVCEYGSADAPLEDYPLPVRTPTRPPERDRQLRPSNRDRCGSRVRGPSRGRIAPIGLEPRGLTDAVDVYPEAHRRLRPSYEDE